MNTNKYLSDKSTELLHTKNLHCNSGFYILTDESLSSFLNSFSQNSVLYLHMAVNVNTFLRDDSLRGKSYV